jgi:hypothetical protein
MRALLCKPVDLKLTEGACKTTVGRRLKHGRARWLVPRVENAATPCSLLYSDEWDAFRQSDAA